MDANTFATMISSYGFPIVCCIVMFRYLEKERESHQEEMKGMTNALNENTKVMEQIRTMLARLIDHDTD